MSLSVTLLAATVTYVSKVRPKLVEKRNFKIKLTTVNQNIIISENNKGELSNFEPIENLE